MSDRRSPWTRALALLCLLLILCAARAQTIHVHDGNFTGPDRDCSICSVAHSTAVVAHAFQPAPIFSQTSLVTAPQPSLPSLLSVSSLYIRPPPAAA